MKHDFTNKHSENESHLDVCLVPAGLRLTITTHTAISGWFNPAQAPAIALAILEAAGVEGAYHGSYNAGSDWQLEHVTGELGEYVRGRAFQAAEARELAELEAEALMLANSAVLAVGNPPYQSIEHMSDTSLRKWLAVARRARELAKEATK